MRLNSKPLLLFLTGACAGIGYVSGAPAVETKIYPLVDVQTGYFLGASAGPGRWVQPEHAKKSIAPGQTYQIYSAGSRLGTATGSVPVSQGAPCEDTLYVTLKLAAGIRKAGGLGSMPKPSAALDLRTPALALAAPWKAMPRIPKPLNPKSATYVTAVHNWLASKGLAKSKVQITQLWQVDLEGDGTSEVLITATNYGGGNGSEGQNPRTQAGDYSVVLLRKLIGGKVITLPLEAEYYTKGSSFAAPNVHAVLAALDVDGDGKMEVITRGRYYEGDWVAVYQINAKSFIKPVQSKPVLSSGCGA